MEKKYLQWNSHGQFIPIASVRLIMLHLMTRKNRMWVALWSLLVLAVSSCREPGPAEDREILSCRLDLSGQELKFYWKDEKGIPFQRIQNLKQFLEAGEQTLVFAMNGGMYRPDHSPLGLYIEEYQMLAPLDTAAGTGNFYLKPNGVFYILAGNIPRITRTEDFVLTPDIRFATQSGPLLVVNGRIHPAFKPGSGNRNIRNGVGILPDGRILLAMSRQKINFYDFAAFFRTAGCRQALYLDGLVSRTYLPARGWEQLDGDFGVIMAVSVPRSHSQSAF